MNLAVASPVAFHCNISIMCGRFTLQTPESKIRQAFHLPIGEQLGLTPRYNIAPSQFIPIVRNNDSEHKLALAKWGLVPHWSKEPKTKYSTINARIETVAEKPTYRTPFKSQRCLIPADGFYEWKLINGHKIPHYIRMRTGGVFAFAGIWDRWEGDGEVLDSCSIIVMPASDVMKPIHQRMPAIIAPAHYDLWLDSRVTDKDEIMGYLTSAPSDQLRFYPISPWVNSPQHDDERCIQPA
jgi:putative SOS response-associated peptidase YedK